MLPNEPFSDGVPFFFPFNLFPVILGEIQWKQKFCRVIYMGYQPHRRAVPSIPRLPSGWPLLWHTPGHSPTQNEPFKEVKKSFLPSYIYMETSINGQVKICLFLKNRPSIYDMFGIGNTSRLLFP
jgi:hypothetical protein